ncbi:MAG: homoserine kinase [Phycisphaerae bacterium]|nr:homoserine kinase [Gemmatimonadaceae bacterium]
MSGAHTRSVIAYAPGSIGNFGPAIDVLGCALTGAGDEVRAAFNNTSEIIVDDAGHPSLSNDPLLHTSAIAAREVLSRAGLAGHGVTLAVTKGLPLSGGQGGSAASAIAAAVAVNVLVSDAGKDSLDTHALLSAALVAESTVAGRHLDNLAPSLLGGVCCVRSIDPPDVSRVQVNMPLWIALAHPAVQVRTADARGVLPQFVPRAMLIDQIANVAAQVSALATGDVELLARALTDHYAEPARAPLVPGFYEAKRAGLEAGALGGSFSGSGPTTFMVCAAESTALAVAEAMRWAYEVAGVACTARVATIDFEGARWRRE